MTTFMTKTKDWKGYFFYCPDNALPKETLSIVGSNTNEIYVLVLSTPVHPGIPRPRVQLYSESMYVHVTCNIMQNDTFREGFFKVLRFSMPPKFK